MLQGLNHGDELSLYASPDGGSALGHATLTTIGARSSALPNDVPAATCAERDQAAPPAPLGLTAPLLANPNDGFDYAKWRAALDQYTGEATPDLVPILTEGQIAFAGPDGQLDPAGLNSTSRIQPQDGETPAFTVDHAMTAAAHSLRRLFASLAGRNLIVQAPLKLDWHRKPTSDCETFSPAEPVDPSKGVEPCDQLWLGFKNNCGRNLDMSILYLNADFSITRSGQSEACLTALRQKKMARRAFRLTLTSALPTGKSLCLPSRSKRVPRVSI